MVDDIGYIFIETPLIYRAIPSWYIAVEKIKDKLLANNEKTYWYV